jgi:hypothetical protein
MRSGHKHHDEHCGADERRCPKIDLEQNQSHRSRDNPNRNEKTPHQPAAFLFPSGEPGREKKDDGNLRDFGGLKRHRAQADPAPRTIDAHPEVRHETKRERNEGEAKPDPPGPQPEMVIDDGTNRADDKSHTQPDRLALDEKIHVAMAVFRKSARAGKHDDADGEHPQNSQAQKISALAMH